MVYVATYQPLTTKARGEKLEKKENLEVHRLAWFGHNWFHKLEAYPVLEFMYLTPGLFIYLFYFLLKNHRKIDVLHANGLVAAFIAKFLAGVFNKKSIMSTCAVYNFRKGSWLARMVKWLLFDFEMILPLADFSKKELIHIGLPADKMKAYYLWINQDAYKPRDKEEIKNLMNLQEEFIVLFVGRFIKIKGVEILIEVAKQVDKKISFLFIGDHSPLLKAVEDAASKYKNINLIKNISGQQLIPYYQAADILVVPSQYEEAFGKVIIEALSCGTPVIGADKGAIPYVLDSSVGRIVAPTVENIKREVEYLYGHRYFLNELTLNCRPYAEKNFSIKNAAVIADSYSS